MSTVSSRLWRAVASGVLLLGVLALAEPATAETINFDLRTWTQAGGEDEGNWNVSADGSEVIQTVNGGLTYFVSPEKFSSASITGHIEVQTTGDDDLIGFVMGYNGPDGTDDFNYDHLLLDWKQTSQTYGGCTAEEGFTLMRVDGQLSSSPDERVEGNGFVLPTHWCHEQNDDDPRVQVLATKWGGDKGWADQTDYTFTLEYGPTRVRILINGAVIFDVLGQFPEGSFGFYNYSQPSVRYSGFAAQERAERLSGADRYQTSVSISQDSYANGEGQAVVLARGDKFADSLAGAPFAVDRDAPLLITQSDALRSEVAAEIKRVLGSGSAKTVYLLGGTAALSNGVQSAVQGLGYQVDRIAGNDRFETAVAIANRLGTIGSVLVADGLTFQAALSAGPAASETAGAVLLSAGNSPTAATTAFLNSFSGEKWAIGSAAAAAYPSATALAGANAADTSALVASQFFDGPPIAGLARNDNFADSLGGSTHIATGLAELGRQGGPMLLTPSSSLAGSVGNYLCAEAATIQEVYVYGGTAAVAESVSTAAKNRIDGTGC